MNWSLPVRIAFLAASSLLLSQTPVGELLREADLAYRAKEIPKAVRLFEQALQTDPSLAQAHMMLGIIYAQQNQAGRAVAHFEEVVKAQPQNAAAHFFLARLAGSRSDWTKAAFHYRAALDNGHPDRESATIELAVAEVHVGEPTKALARLTTLRAPAGQRQAVAYYTALALAYRHGGNPSGASEALQRAIALNPTDAALHEQRIEALIAAGEYSESLTEAIQAQRKFPDHSGIEYQFGIGGFYVPGSPFTSLALRNLRDLAPRDARVLVLEGLDRINHEEPGGAIELLRQAVAQDVPESRLFLAMALAANSEYGEAEKVLPRTGKETPDGNFQLTLARILIAQNRHREALPVILKAEVCMPKHPEVQLQLSRVYEHLGDAAKANQHKKTWEQLRAAGNVDF